MTNWMSTRSTAAATPTNNNTSRLTNIGRLGIVQLAQNRNLALDLDLDLGLDLGPKPACLGGDISSRRGRWRPAMPQPTYSVPAPR